MADFDEEMQRALEQSALEHMATCTTLVLDGETRIQREDLGPACEQHWKPPCRPGEGTIFQIDTVNQFAQHWAPLIREFNAPSSICGYMVMANALVLQQSLPASCSLSEPELQQILRKLREPTLLEPYIREGMDFVCKSRKAWMASHQGDFNTQDKERKYLSAWVANYEISDFFREKAAQGRLDKRNVQFLRYNQWPQLQSASDEERKRLEEEKQFGGNSDAAGNVDYAPGDAVFIVESFLPERLLQRPEEFLRGLSDEQKPSSAGNVFILDLNGHFVIGLVAKIQNDDGTLRSALIVINTTGTRYIDNMTCLFAFDLAFPPEPCDDDSFKPEVHVLHDQQIVSSSVNPAAIAQLTDAMGFPKAMAEQALEAAGGDINRALEILLGSA